MKNLSFLITLGAGLLLGPAFSEAQPAARPGGDRNLQVGFGLLPGIGAQAGYVRPSSIITTEGISYFNFSPRYGEGEGHLKFTLGLGGSLRLMGIVDALTDDNLDQYNVDLGLRLGPSLDLFYREEWRNDIHVLLDPFVRGTMQFYGRNTFFAELGPLSPLLRVGLWVDI